MLRIALTRSQEDIERDRKLFEEAGFKVIPIPLLEEEPLDFEVPEVDFDFVIFQSPRSARLFLSRCKLKEEKIVVVGEKTKKEVEAFGYHVWAMPENYYGEEVVKLFKNLSGKVLVPKSAVGRDTVVEGLRSLGFEVYTIDIYRVKPKLYKEQELVQRLSLANAILFASPSAIKSLLANLQKDRAKEILKGLIAICIGKTTKEFLEKELALECIMPEKPTVEKVVELLKSMA